MCKLLGITDIYNEFVGFNPDDVLAKLNDEGKAKALEYISLLLLSEQFQKKEATLNLESDYRLTQLTQPSARMCEWSDSIEH